LAVLLVPRHRSLFGRFRFRFHLLLLFHAVQALEGGTNTTHESAIEGKRCAQDTYWWCRRPDRGRARPGRSRGRRVASCRQRWSSPCCPLSLHCTHIIS
jgi:hypothetical protein